ncbi:MAG: TRAP transporter small permease [Bacillota bacterium]|nr:TRAP transporter small permease [Bacillota bacterium]
MLNTIKKIAYIYNNAEEKFSIILTALLAAIVFIAVFFRYVLNSSLYWGDEASRFLFLWLIWISINIPFRDGSHIRMLLIYNKLKIKGKLCLDLISDFLVLATSAYMFYYGMELVLNLISTQQTSHAIGIPLYIVYACLPLGMFTVSIRQITLCVKHGRGLYRFIHYNEIPAVVTAEYVTEETIGVPLEQVDQPSPKQS